MDRLWAGMKGRERPGKGEAPDADGWTRPSGGSLEALSEEQARYLHERAECPYCRSGMGLYEGPRGGASINLFCGNPGCDSRFNVIDSGRHGFVPMGEFIGPCPADFIMRRKLARH